jgi:hypothetical protein
MENHHIRTVGCLYARCISSIEARSGAKPLGLFTNAIPHLHQKLCMSASHLGTSTKLFTRTIVDAVEEPVVSAQYSMFQPAIQHLGRDSYFLHKRTNWPLLREPYQTVLPMCSLPHRETRIRTGKAICLLQGSRQYLLTHVTRSHGFCSRKVVYDHDKTRPSHYDGIHRPSCSSKIISAFLR